MLENGISLFELRSQAASGIHADHLGAFRSSKASLHAKTFAVDGKRIFIGSFNFDPRSAALNTEMGLMIHSEQMAQKLHKAFDQGMVGLTWRVEQRNGRLVWIDSYTGSMSVSEPGQSALLNIILTIVGWLPVKWLL